MNTDIFYGLLPEHLLLALLLTLMLIEICGRGKRFAGYLFTLVAGFGSFVLLHQMNQGYVASIIPGELFIDRFALNARLIILVCSVIYGVCSLGTFRTVKSWMLICSSLLGALLMCDSAGFITLFLGLELLSLPAFALMVHRSEQTDAAEGALKYLLLSAVASAMILFGISLNYGNTGTLSLIDFAVATAAGGRLNLAAASLLLCGFFLKVAVFPFHGWAPDAYSGARLQVTALLASVIKAAAVLGLLRILGAAVLPDTITGIAVVLGVISIFYGNITAIHQTTFKRMLAYSSIAHAGYMIFALADNAGSRVDALSYYVMVYALTTIVACTCFALLVDDESDELATLDGAFAAKPISSLLLVFAMLSLAGIPPLPGFFAKLYIFKSAIASGQLWPAVLAFIGSFVGVTYYLGIVSRLFKPAEIQLYSRQSTAPCRLGGALVGALVLLFFVMTP